MVFVGVLAFGCFFLSDYNDWRPGKTALRLCFPAGALLLSISTLFLCLAGTPALHGAARALSGVFAAGFLLLLGYTLFGALPVKEAYAQQERGRSVCTRGVYALCRHPGFWCFAGLSLFLWLSFGLPLYAVVVFNICNFLLICFEDLQVFPAVLTGYEAYRRTTPFLFPTRQSLCACRQSLRERKGEV